MNKPLILILISGVFAMLPAGCHHSPVKQAEDLRIQTLNYGKLIRWRAYDDAKKYIRRRDGSHAALNHALLNEIRVTRYEVTAINISASKDEAVVTAEISYYHERVNKVHNIRDEQHWWRDAASKRWLLDGALPNFTP